MFYYGEFATISIRQILSYYSQVCDMIQKIIVVFFCRICFLFKDYPYLCGQKI